MGSMLLSECKCGFQSPLSVGGGMNKTKSLNILMKSNNKYFNQKVDSTH